MHTVRAYRGPCSYVTGPLRACVCVAQNGRSEQDFLAEAAVFQHVSGHPHVIQFYGVCVHPAMCLVTEFAANGSVEKLLVHSTRKVGWRHIAATP